MKIFDSSSLISIFREVEYPKVLQNCVNRKYRLVIPNTVYNELRKNKKTYSLFADFIELFEIINIKKECLENLSARYPYLHEGELGVICLALEENKLRNKNICILDDKKARNFCKKNSIRITGLIGLLIWQKKNGDLNRSECKIIYKNIYASKFRIGESILGELVR
jgi:predicted nucleic acid-binding protein